MFLKVALPSIKKAMGPVVAMGSVLSPHVSETKTNPSPKTSEVIYHYTSPLPDASSVSSKEEVEDKDETRSDNESCYEIIEVADSSVIQSIIHDPPTSCEIDMSIHAVEKSGVLEKRFPTISKKALDKTLDLVRDLLHEPSLMKALKEQIDIQKTLSSSSMSVVSSISEDNQFELIDHEWMVLAKRNECKLCHDLLAAPHLLNCEHSFCKSCLNTHLDSCSLDGHSSVELIHKCPVCKEEIFGDYRYEATLDENIASEAENLSESVYYKEWSLRRKVFLDERKDNTFEKFLENHQKIMEEELKQSNNEKKSETIFESYPMFVAAITILIVSTIIIIRHS